MILKKLSNTYKTEGTKKTILKILNHLAFKIKRIPLNVFLFLVPKNELGDKIFALREFIYYHKRFPSNKLYLNDFLYKIKTEELQNPERVFVSDKEFVKMYIKAKIGNKYNVPTIKILKNKNEIENYKFPTRCCIKSTHASGHYILRSSGEVINKDQIKLWLKTNYYLQNREKNYKYLEPKIIVEPLVFDQMYPEDFKMFCYLGKVKMIQVDLNRHKNHKRLYFTKKWKKLNFSLRVPQANVEFKKPYNLEEMIKISEKIAADFNFIRVDLYSNGKTCFVGELTNCHESANANFFPANSEQWVSKQIFS